MNAMKWFNAKREEKGFILITTFLFVALLEVFSAAIFSRSFIFMDATERNKNKMVAFNMAEAGLDSALTQLKTNSAYSGTNYTSLGNNGGYQVTVTTPAANTYLVQTTGYGPGNVATARAYETRTISAYANYDTNAFDYAVFGETSLTLNGGSGLIDSYNSGNGAYGGANVGNNGNIASDGTITINGGTQVHGTITQNPNINCSSGTTSVASSGALSLSGNSNYTLAAGTYHFSSIKVSGNAKITTLGAVTIYVDGEVSLGGNGVATAGNLPTNFMLIATGDSSISVSGNGNFYGGVYAPKSAVTSNAGGYYGAVISNSFAQNGNGAVHYDDAMANVTTPCVQVKMLSWRETNTAAS